MKFHALAGALLSLVFVSNAVAANSAATSGSLEAIIHRSIVAGFLEKPQEVERDAFAPASQGSGLEDNLAWLWAESLATPEAREAGYAHVLGEPVDEKVEASLRSALAENLVSQIRATRKQDRWDRWADLFNSIGHNLARVGNGQLSAALNVVSNTVFLGRHFTKVTERERKEWWLIDTYLRKQPSGADAARLRARKAAIEAQLQKDAIRKCMELARHYADREWWPEADYYVRAAEQAGYGGKARFRRKAREAVANDRRWKERALTVADTERFLQSREQVDAYQKMLKALAMSDPRALTDADASAGKVLAVGPMAAEAADVHSILFEWAGDRRQALAIQRDLAARYPETRVGQAAAARLHDPQYNPRAGFDREAAEYRRRQKHYVLTGDRKLHQHVELMTQLVIPSVPRIGLGAAFLLTDIMVRSVVVSVGTPVSPADVLGAGEEVLANPRNGLTPDEEREIRLRMGALYERLRRFEDASRSYQQARALTPQFKEHLAEKAADEQYRRIMQIEDSARQLMLLERLIKASTDTAVAARAKGHLDRLRVESKIDFSIPYDWLTEDRAHWRQLGAAIPSPLLDGRRSNGEVNERGLVFWRDSESSATFVLTDERRGYVNLTPARKAGLRASATLWADDKISLEEAETALAVKRVPFEVRGSAGPAGILVYPTLKKAPLTEEDKRRFK